MATTVQNIIDAGFSYSSANDPSTLATDTELTDLIDQLQKEYFARAARINPLFFGEVTTVAAPGASTPWARPSDAGIVVRIEESDGTKVNIVPYDDRTGAFAPRVYMLGQSYYTVGEAADPDPSADALDFWHSRVPADLTATSDSLDSDWVEHFNRMLEIEVAIYLAHKDQRGGEVPGLDERLARLQAQFDNEVEVANVGQVARFGHRKQFVSPTPTSE